MAEGNDDDLRSIARMLEGLLLVSGTPVVLSVLADAVGVPLEVAKSGLDLLARSCIEGGRALRVEEIAGGYVLRTAPDLSELLSRFVLSESPSGISPAAMEALAVVAYMQPISRGQVSEVRGVNSDGVMRLLSERGLIAGDRRKGSVTEPVLFRTTQLFLERFGLVNLDSLPPLSEFVPSGEVLEVLEESLRKR